MDIRSLEIILTPLVSADLAITESMGNPTTLIPLSISKFSVAPQPHPTESTFRALRGTREATSARGSS